MKRKLLTVSIAFLLASISASAVTLESSGVDPGGVNAGTTVDNQLVNLEVSNLSADGDTDRFYFEFPDYVNLSPNTVNSNLAVSSSQEVVDRDGDGESSTVTFAVSPSGDENVDANVTLDTGIDYTREDAVVDISVVDSAGDQDGDTSVVRVSEDEPENEEPVDSSELGLMSEIVSFFRNLL